MTDFLNLKGFDLLPHFIAIAAAYLLALPIGWNRERAERSAGIRTFPLVAMASCGFIQAVESITAGSPEATARVVEGVITGMGFIGGGAILHKGDRVQGTATAAALWATGAIGVAVGLGSFDVAVMIALVTGVTLFLLSPLKREIETARDDDNRNGTTA
jgi:putative Mg2+ transporter-C (MgtC) family protein